MGDALDWLDPALAELRRSGLLRTVTDRQRRDSGRGPVDLASNDYLGLSEDPRLAAAAAQCVQRWGSGAGASRLILGGTPPHRALEQALARWKCTQDAMVFSSGYMANVGTIAALAGPGDVILSDALNHASIIDGCRLSSADVHVYRHGDIAHVRTLLRRHARTNRKTLIVTDGVFSMDGDAADLVALADEADAHGAMLMVDDAHGSGVIGPDGRGTPAAQGVADRVHIHLGTLSKAVGSAGGFVAGHADLLTWLRNRARSFVFDTAPPPSVMAAALEGVRIAQAEPERRLRATGLARRLAAGLNLPEPAACVVPLVVGQVDPALALAAALRDAGFGVLAIRPPTVPAGTSRLRFATSAAHDEETIDALIAAIRALA